MLVPSNSVHVPRDLGTDDSTCVPGARTSGFIRYESAVGPADENAATRLLDIAPTVIARAADAGDATEPIPKSAKSFPAATTGTTPASAAASSAAATTSRDGSTSGCPKERLITSMPSRTAASIAATSSGAFPSRPTPDAVGMVSTL
jgi:hypothetical protein